LHGRRIFSGKNNLQIAKPSKSWNDDMNQGDAASERSFVGLFLRHQRSLYGFIMQLVHDYDDAEDLLQKTGLVLWQKFEQFEPGTDFVSWARQIAKFEVHTYLKTKRRSRVSFSTATIDLLAEDIQAESPEADLRQEALMHCLDDLRPGDRDLVRNCYSRRGAMGQIARDLGRSIDGIYQSLRRIRHALLQCIERRITTEGRP
jgi:RNA polymerase sigma-70 factor, ECF subfamily